MSTWTSRTGLLLAAGLGLAACDGGDIVGMGLGLSRSAPQAIAVAGDSVVVAGPPGYCVDRAASRDGQKAFVLLGSCASLTRSADSPSPAEPGIVTVVVSSDPAAYIDVDSSLPALTAFMKSDQGKAVLSRSGRSADVEVLGTRSQEGVLFLRLRDRSGGPLAGAAPDYWRAILDVNDKLVTISVLGFDDSPMSEAAGFAAIATAAARIRSGSRQL